jgi:hypothetical protein
MYCTTCWSEFNSDVTALTHYESNSHSECAKFQREFKENRLLGKFYCETCSLYTNSFNSLAIHLGSKSHRNKIASKERIQSLEVKKTDLIKTQSLYDFSKNPQSPQNNPAATLSQLKIHISSPSSSNTISKLNNYCEICSTQLDSAIAYAVD